MPAPKIKIDNPSFFALVMLIRTLLKFAINGCEANPIQQFGDGLHACNRWATSASQPRRKIANIMKQLLAGLVGVALMMGVTGTVFAEAKQEIKQDAQTLKNFSTMPEQQIPPAVLKKAKGFAIFHVTDVAFLANGKGGPGIVVSRTNTGWSGPMFVGLGGVGLWAQMGAKVKELVLVLNTDKAVEALSHGNVKLGAELTASAGPAGANAEAETTFTNKDIYSYAQSNGVFTGLSLEGSVIAPREDMNRKFYGKKVTPSEILAGKVQPPAAADPLMVVLHSVAPAGVAQR